jgi:hypothetical protein
MPASISEIKRWNISKKKLMRMQGTESARTLR